jgi:hypothetical protein
MHEQWEYYLEIILTVNFIPPFVPFGMVVSLKIVILLFLAA